MRRSFRRWDGTVLEMSEPGDAFQVLAPDGGGPGVLVLHSAWGLHDGVRDYCRAISDAGFNVVAPDLLDGRVAQDAEEADELLHAVDPNRLSVLVQAGTRALYAAGGDADAAMSVIGFSMGGSLAYWVAARMPTVFRRAVSYCGLQSIDFTAAEADFLGHFAEHDPLVTDDDRIYTESLIRLGGNESAFHVYPGVRAGFAEPGHPDFDEEAAVTSLERTLAFL